MALQETAIGPLPQDWSVEPLGDLFSVTAGGDWDPENSVKGRDSRHPYPVVANAVTPGATQGYCSYYKVPGDTLTVTGRGDVGHAVYRLQPYVPIVRLLALEPKREVSSKFYVEYINNRVQFSLESTGVPQLTAPQVRPYLLALPPLEQQRAIATVLGDFDELIAALERLVNKKQWLKRGMIQQLLSGRTRLAGFDEPWTHMRLGDIGTTVRGVGYKPDEDLSDRRTAHTVDLLRANNVQRAELDLRDVQYVHERRVRPDQYLRVGDVLVCAANGSKQLVGKAASVQTVMPGRTTFGAFMMVYRPNSSRVLPAYAALHFQTKPYRDLIDVLLAGSSINNLRPSDVASLEVPVPHREEQIAIAAAINDAAGEIHKLQARCAKVRAIKLGIMQQLLTGRIQVSVEDES